MSKALYNEHFVYQHLPRLGRYQQTLTFTLEITTIITQTVLTGLMKIFLNCRTKLSTMGCTDTLARLWNTPEPATNETGRTGCSAGGLYVGMLKLVELGEPSQTLLRLGWTPTTDMKGVHKCKKCHGMILVSINMKSI